MIDIDDIDYKRFMKLTVDEAIQLLEHGKFKIKMNFNLKNRIVEIKMKHKNEIEDLR